MTSLADPSQRRRQIPGEKVKCKHSLVMAEAGERWALRSPWVSGAELWVGEQELMEGIQKAGKAEVRRRACEVPLPASKREA